MRKILFLAILFAGIAFTSHAQQTQKDTTLQEFVGKYTFPQGSIISSVTLTIENGSLFSRSSAGESALEKTKEDLFYIIEFKGTAKFVRDTSGKVSGVIIDASGYHIEGPKVE